MEEIASTVDCLPELGGKSLLVRMPPPLVEGLRKIEPEQ